LGYYRTSGEILSLREIEEMEQDDESELDTNVLDSDEHVPLPSRWELNKYEIMEEFIFLLEDRIMQEVLPRAYSRLLKISKPALSAYSSKGSHRFRCNNIPFPHSFLDQ
jgi:hypothetical protein